MKISFILFFVQLLDKLNEKIIKICLYIKNQPKNDFGIKETIKSENFKTSKSENFQTSEKINEDLKYSRLAVNMTGNWETKYDKRCNVALFCIKCPCEISRDESDTISEELWICQKCKKHLDYGFDDKLYCGCGRSLCENFIFKCGHKNHGFIKIKSEIINEYISNLKPKPVYNILILGETGVGKSTWINGIANYMTFDTLKEAKDSDNIISLVNTKFTVFDENFKEKEIKIEVQKEDTNEIMQDGQSATQSPRSYVFEQPEYHCRLIDTPGIGDTRGAEIDKRNFAAILAFISRHDNIHGICILLKPNNARLTVMFKFCIKELLAHLHKNASKNIVFCFTNARSTFYKPGDTYPTLKNLLAEYKEVQIELNKDTIYCTDNESYRFLCANKQGIKFSDDDFKNYEASWKISVTETKRLLDYITLLQPHNLKETLSLNEIREMIVKLTRPLADTVNNININVAVLKEKVKELSDCRESNNDLEKKMLIPTVDLVAVPLDYPQTVCTSPGCVKLYKLPGTSASTVNYTTVCHDHCYIKGIKPEQYPCIELKNCDAIINKSYCSRCNCDWSKHMHITYRYKETLKLVIDEQIQKRLQKASSMKEKIEIFVSTLYDKIESLENEQKIITEYSAKFGVFLKQNAIVPYNDCMAEYLDMLITQQTGYAEITKNYEALDNLKRMKADYLEEVIILQTYTNDTTIKAEIKYEEIYKSVNQLYDLKINGNTIKSIFTAVRAGVTMNHFHEEEHIRPHTNCQFAKSPLSKCYYSKLTSKKKEQFRQKIILQNVKTKATNWYSKITHDMKIRKYIIGSKVD